MDSSSSSSINLALAALFGASVMAISAFFIHKRSVDQVLDRLLKLRSATTTSAAEDPSLASYSSDEIDIAAADREEIDEEVATDDNVLGRYRVSSSMPNVGLPNHWFDDRPTKMEFGSRALAASWDKLNLIPSGLPPLHTARKDGSFVLLILLCRFHCPVYQCFHFYVKSSWYSYLVFTELAVRRGLGCNVSEQTFGDRKSEITRMLQTHPHSHG